MPKPDQKISISAALQRPQRQKALPKPQLQNPQVQDPQAQKDIEVELQPVTEVISNVLTDLPSQAPELNEVIKKKIEFKPAIAEKSKPKLKPKLKPEVVTTVETGQNLETLGESVLTDLGSEPSEAISEIINTAQSETSAESPAQEAPIQSNHHEVIETFDRVFEDEPSIDPESLDPEEQTPDQELEQELQIINQEENQNSELSPPIFWCQAVGLLSGRYIPSVETFQKGELVTDAGFTYKAFVLSKAIKALEKKTDLSMPHKFVVYPKTSKLHGVRFEILATDVSSKIEEFEDGQFNIRGLVTKQLENSFLVEIQRRPEYLHPNQHDRFTLEVKGEIPIDLLKHFVYLKCQLTEGYLKLISYEDLACPITPKKISTVEKPILKPKAPVAPIEQDSSLLGQSS